uniref:Uncharacterized protein n=1 Tax=Myoviridae sp. ctcaJ26 TaxID=2825138 RepID=A0A8S5NX05_9CAUD|nr:MAG TPA: hypothetical protein [Myoviridae sp. ctcaJ26]
MHRALFVRTGLFCCPLQYEILCLQCQSKCYRIFSYLITRK